MPKRILEGKVVSDKANKTVTVLVERRTMHPIYKKYVKKSKRYAAHDDTNMFREGDMVRIQECAPISKSKTWTVITDAPEGREARAFKVTEAAKPVAKKPAAKPAAAKTEADAPKTAAKKPAAKKAAAKKSEE
jgi:small subunit ribosomal protein S17